MKWLWGEKRQEKTHLDFSTETDQAQLIRTKVKVHYEVDIEYPTQYNVAQLMRDVKHDMQLPPGVTVHDAIIHHVEVYET